MPSWIERLTKHIASAEAEDYFYAPLTSANGTSELSENITVDRDYVTIRLRSYRIVEVRKWTGKFYASVQSRINYPHINHGMIDYQKVVVPELKELDPEHVDRVLPVDERIVGPIPYRGEIKLELGLFSVKGSDLAKPYLNLLSTIATKSGVPMLGIALPYVELLREGANQLFGDVDHSELEVGLSQSWPAKDFKTGNWVLIRTPKEEMRNVLPQLRLDPKDGKITTADGRPYKSYPYLVFRIEASRQRDDWFMIPEIKEAWDSIGEALKRGQVDEAETLMKRFQIVAQLSGDLVPEDAERLVKNAKERMHLLQSQKTISRKTPSVNKKGQVFPSLEELDLYGLKRQPGIKKQTKSK